ncbi:MAG: glycosyltransferase family 4 protein [Candidatus Nealsonbacteria bacterium]|nr:MAG: glycosyltransferase family 4 protein [Candidatus Nealsonbacteria bacterium]
MKILIIAPLTRKISPKITAARPRVIFDLATGLQKRKHKVSVLGTKDSYIPRVKIIPVIKKGFYELSSSLENPFYTHISFLAKMAKVLEKIGNDFDIIHNHCYPEFINLLVEKNIKIPIVTTIHAQMMPELDNILSLFPDSYFICVSKAAKDLAKKTKIYRVIYNGIDTNLYKFSSKKEGYLLWIGRLSKAKDKKGNFMDPKGVRWAIRLAKETGLNLLLAGNVEDPEFFERDVKPYLSKKIKWIGPVSFEQPLSKKEVVKLMQKAKAFLMTVNWEEPFGLVMAEAQSCGTPVIGFNRGSVSELVINGKTGFVVKPKEGIEGLKRALRKIDRINPKDCREHIEKKFSAKKMVEEYEKIYYKILNK